MAHKAAKQQATRNLAFLKRAHLTSLGVNLFFVILRFLLFRASCTRATYLLYFIFALPGFAIEFWLEKIGRPTMAQNGELHKSGEDLEAQGLIEYLWDVLYWSWGSTVVASLFGNRAWWLWIVVPLYSVWLMYTTFGGIKQTMGGITGQETGDAASHDANTSSRQKKMEKRGGQRVQYR